MHEGTAVEVEFEVPESNRGQKEMCRNLEAFFVGAMKRKAVEVSERKLTPEREGANSSKPRPWRSRISLQRKLSRACHSTCSPRLNRPWECDGS